MIPLRPLLPLIAGVFGGLWNGSSARRSELVQLSRNQFSEFVPFIEFARAAYCAPTKIEGWQCGGQSSLLTPYRFRMLTDAT